MIELKPAVGYLGGKRWLLPLLRSYLNPAQISFYAEPFVGMGAVYLDLRARGYRGPVALGETNVALRDFWTLVHHEKGGEDLRRAAVKLTELPATVESYARMMDTAAVFMADRAARFLWITNFAYANHPPSYIGTKWDGRGTKLSSIGADHNNAGRRYPWESCLKRLTKIVSNLKGLPCVVAPDGRKLLEELPEEAIAYADPPYWGQTEYCPDQAAEPTYLLSCARTRAACLLSETLEAAAILRGWQSEEIAALTDPIRSRGRRARRTERLYVNRRAVLVLGLCSS